MKPFWAARDREACSLKYRGIARAPLRLLNPAAFACFAGNWDFDDGTHVGRVRVY